MFFNNCNFVNNLIHRNVFITTVLATLYLVVFRYWCLLIQLNTHMVPCCDVVWMMQEFNKTSARY